jgi:hypothetical protein
MNLNQVAVPGRILFPYSPDRTEILQRSGAQACALPIGSSRGTKGAGARR